MGVVAAPLYSTLHLHENIKHSSNHGTDHLPKLLASITSDRPAIARTAVPSENTLVFPLHEWRETCRENGGYVF